MTVSVLCPTCDSDRHAECCRRCGRLVRSDRRGTGFCTEACAARQAAEDRASASAEAEPACYFCRKPATADDFCSGCGKHICGECDTNPDSPMGGHDPEMHDEKLARMLGDD